MWGNHSSTQFPDYENALIGGRPAVDVIPDRAWLEGEFLTTVQKRGAAIIEARGLSSAASAANAAIDSVVSILRPTAPGEWASLAVVSHGEYGVPDGLQFGFPVRSDGTGWEIVADQQHGDSPPNGSGRRPPSWPGAREVARPAVAASAPAQRRRTTVPAALSWRVWLRGSQSGQSRSSRARRAG